MSEDTNRGQRKTREGTVVSSKMQKTIVVEVSRRVRHPLYGKEMIRSRKLYAHDEQNEAKPGDVVRVVETRPMSRLKRWRLVGIVRKAEATA